jgi:methionine sulfoxide reductase heme-binding subunit
VIIEIAVVPSPLWYVNRGSGAVTMLLLTASVVLGIGTTVRWKSTFWPRYINAGLHRNVSLMFVCFLVVHVAAAILDPFARLGLTDALIPFTSSYRPFWLGLGVVAAELAVALLLTTAVRGLIGYRTWRVIHWLSYVSWPLALLHGLGTGSDIHVWWFQWLEGACVLAVWAALISWRLAFDAPRNVWPRLVAAGLSSILVVALVVWVVNGPLQPGWARIAGTPPTLLKTAPTATP